MLLTIRTTHQPATDLRFLLHNHGIDRCALKQRVRPARNISPALLPTVSLWPAESIATHVVL
jgi:hypothetical protein